jgi:hypothetical protein
VTSIGLDALVFGPLTNEKLSAGFLNNNPHCKLADLKVPGHAH